MKSTEEIINSVEARLPAEQASLHKREDAKKELRAALSQNPYHLNVRLQLISILEDEGNEEEKSDLIDDVEELPVNFGPDFTEAI